MRSIPAIAEVMTNAPHTIGNDISVKKAHEMMREGHYRHLPVQHGGKLVGLISDRDVSLASSFGDPEKLTVDDVMTQAPYTVKDSTSLDQVVAQMAEQKIGSAIVVDDHEKVVGIFTAVDALKLFLERLKN